MNSIILTGPIGVGKSTQGKLLSKKLGMPLCVYDEVKDKYRYKIGLSREKALAINDKDGVYAMLRYMNEFKSKILKPIIDDHQGHIIDLEAGAHSFDEPHQVERAQLAFEGIEDVFLLLPSNDLETNIKILPGLKENYEVNTFLIMHPTNELLTKKTIFTLNKTPNEIMAEVIELLVKSSVFLLKETIAKKTLQFPVVTGHQPHVSPFSKQMSPIKTAPLKPLLYTENKR